MARRGEMLAANLLGLLLAEVVEQLCAVHHVGEAQ